MILLLQDRAFQTTCTGKGQDKRTLKKINALLADIQRNGAMQGIGKPEPLKHRRDIAAGIDEQNRLVYEIDELQNIVILSCKGHYED